MRAFITGVTGFIGSHLAELLIGSGNDVLGVGKSGRWRKDVPADLKENVKLLSWNIEEPASTALQSRVREFAPDAIFHFAGISIPAKCGKDTPSAKAMSVNVGGTRNVLDLLDFEQKLSKPPKFVFASTVHVYSRVDASSPYVTESATLDPISAYGQTKLECEQEIQRRSESTSLPYSIARGFHHIGPRQPDGLMLTDWIGQLSDPNCVDLHVHSTNSNLDLIDVRDAAKAYKCLAAAESPSGVYNLGSGRISNSGEVLEAILSLTERKVNIIERSSDERWNAIAETSKLNCLGWIPKLTYQDTLRAMLLME